MVLLATLSHLGFSRNLTDASYRLARAFAPALGWRDAIDAMRNVVLFAGLGGVWVLTARVAPGKTIVKHATLAGFVVSLLIEAVQTFSPVRDASILDVITDTAGALGGAFIIAWTLRAVAQHERRQKAQAPAFLIAGPYLLAVFAEALTPLFDSAPLKTEGGPLTRFHAMWELAARIDWSAIPIFDAPLFLAAGFLAVYLCTQRWTTSKCWMLVASVGPVLVLAAHLSHGAAGLPIHWEAIVTDALSLGIGAYMAGRWLGPARDAPDAARSSTWAILGYAGVLILWGWRPFQLDLRAASIAGELTPEHFEPLGALAERVDLFSIAHTAQQFLLYVPLGVLLASPDFSGTRAALLGGITLAAVIEFGHVLVAMRTFDITNALLAWAGLVIGWAVVVRARREPLRS